MEGGGAPRPDPSKGSGMGSGLRSRARDAVVVVRPLVVAEVLAEVLVARASVYVVRVVVEVVFAGEARTTVLDFHTSHVAGSETFHQ